jgi:hypothetical protein
MTRATTDRCSEKSEGSAKRPSSNRATQDQREGNSPALYRQTAPAPRVLGEHEEIVSHLKT